MRSLLTSLKSCSSSVPFFSFWKPFLASSTRTSCKQSSAHMDIASFTLVSPSKFATIKLSKFGTDRRFSMGKARESWEPGGKQRTLGTAKAVKAQGRSFWPASTPTQTKRSDEIRRFKVWKTCVATVQNPQLSVLYNSTTENVKRLLLLSLCNLLQLLFRQIDLQPSISLHIFRPEGSTEPTIKQRVLICHSYQNTYLLAPHLIHYIKNTSHSQSCGFLRISLD